MKVGFAPQLTLEAAILMRGGFEGLPKMAPKRALYLKLGGPEGGEERDAAGAKTAVAELADKHFAELKALLEAVQGAGHALSFAPLPEIREPLLRL